MLTAKRLGHGVYAVSFILMACLPGTSLLAAQTLTKPEISPTSFGLPNPKLHAKSATSETPMELRATPEWHLLRNGSSFHIYALDCVTLDGLKASLAQWRKLRGDTEVPMSTNVLQGPYCVADVTTLLPDQLLRILDSHSFFDGPNSWTSALLMSSQILTVRAVGEEEFRTFATASACRRLGPSELPQTGDIGVVRKFSEDGDVREKAAFTFVNENMIFTKDSSRHSIPFTVETPSYFLKLNGFTALPERCSRFLLNPKRLVGIISGDVVDLSQGCPEKIEFRRCDARQNENLEFEALATEKRYLQKSARLTPESQAQTELLQLSLKIHAFEQNLERITLGDERLATAQAGGGENALLGNLKSTQLGLLSQLADLTKGAVSATRPTNPFWVVASTLRLNLLSLGLQLNQFSTEHELIHQELVRYPNESWQAVLLSPSLAPGEGIIASWYNCASWSSERSSCP